MIILIYGPYKFVVLEIRPRQSAISDDVLAGSIRPLSDGILRTNHELLSDDNRDSMSAVSSLSEGLTQADDRAKHGGSFVRNTVDERSELAAVSDEERGHVVASDNFRCGTEAAYEDHRKQSIVENASGERRASMDGAVENIPVEHRPSLTAADGQHRGMSVDHGHAVATERVDEVSQQSRHGGGDAAVSHDVAPPPQPSTARSEYMSYRDDFTEMSDNHGTHSATDSRLADLLPQLLRETVGMIGAAFLYTGCPYCHSVSVKALKGKQRSYSL